VLASLDSRPAAQLRARAFFAAGELHAPKRWLASCFCKTRATCAAWPCLPRSRPPPTSPTSAVQWLRRALAIDPYDPEARALAERFLPR